MNIARPQDGTAKFYQGPEIADIKSKVYFSREEEKILDMWLLEMTISEMSIELNMSESSISRKKKKIIDKITKVL